MTQLDRPVAEVNLERFPAIDLDELVAIADLQTRRDRKYVLPFSAAQQIVETVDGRALEIGGRRSFRYESVYFDTPAWDSYLSAARGRPRRFKVRTRTYLDSGNAMIEVKVRDHRGNTVKHRQPHSPDDRTRLTNEALSFVRDVDAAAGSAGSLRRVLDVSYRRSTIVLHDGGGRATIDVEPRWQRDGAGTIGLDDLTIIESKSPGPPSSLDRTLWRHGFRPLNISKYCTGLAALESDLPSNRWHRTMQRHLLVTSRP